MPVMVLARQFLNAYTAVQVQLLLVMSQIVPVRGPQHAADVNTVAVASGNANSVCSAGCVVQMLKMNDHKVTHMDNGWNSW